MTDAPLLTPDTKVAAVLLAGGEGRRIGGDKPSRLLGGKPLFDHVLDRVTAWQLPCAVAVRDSSRADFAGDLPLLEDAEEIGPIGGLVSAFRFAAANGFDAVLTLPCDTPFLPADLPRRLAAAMTAPALAAIAASGERVHPSCGLWRIAAESQLEPYLRERRSLLSFARRLGAATVAWPNRPYDPFFNVNDEADLDAAETILRSR